MFVSPWLACTCPPHTQSKARRLQQCNQGCTGTVRVGLIREQKYWMQDSRNIPSFHGTSCTLQPHTVRTDHSAGSTLGCRGIHPLTSTPPETYCASDMTDNCHSHSHPCTSQLRMDCRTLHRSPNHTHNHPHGKNPPQTCTHCRTIARGSDTVSASGRAH